MSGRGRGDETGADPSAAGLVGPELVQLGLRRPTLGLRVKRRVAHDARALGPLAERVGLHPEEARIACECHDVLFAEVARALEQGARSLAEISAATGLGLGLCGGARCLDAIALHVARHTGRSAKETRLEAAALVSPQGAGGAAELARASLAYARQGDDAFPSEDDDEPELVVTIAGARHRRAQGKG